MKVNIQVFEFFYRHFICAVNELNTFYLLHIYEQTQFSFQ